jgi:hypothetical protein
MAKLSQRRTSKKQKVLQRSNPFVSETFVSFGLLAGAPALETDVLICYAVDFAGAPKQNTQKPCSGANPPNMAFGYFVRKKSAD